jgi:hypothetical protein
MNSAEIHLIQGSAGIVTGVMIALTILWLTRLNGWTSIMTKLAARKEHRLQDQGSTWIVQFENEDLGERYELRDGIALDDSPVPSWFHVCVAQERNWNSYIYLLEQCSCGGLRLRGKWRQKNARRKSALKNRFRKRYIPIFS